MKKKSAVYVSSYYVCALILLYVCMNQVHCGGFYEELYDLEASDAAVCVQEPPREWVLQLMNELWELDNTKSQRYAVYWLYWYKSTNSDTAGEQAGALPRRLWS